MNNSNQILWENNQLSADNYEMKQVQFDYKKYIGLPKIVVLGTIFSISIIKENQNLDYYEKSISGINDYKSQIPLLSKEILENISKRERVNDSIDNFISLNNNWDGYAAVPLSVESAKNARLFIANMPDDSLKYFYDGYPNTHGTISFEWKKDDFNEFFIEIGNKFFAFYMLKDGLISLKGNEVKASYSEFSEIYKIIQGLNG